MWGLFDWEGSPPLSCQRRAVRAPIPATDVYETEDAFVVRIWNDDDPTEYMQTSQLFDDTGWANRRWNASATNGPTGALVVDHFEVVEGLPDLSP